MSDAGLLRVALLRQDDPLPSHGVTPAGVRPLGAQRWCQTPQPLSHIEGTDKGTELNMWSLGFLW